MSKLIRPVITEKTLKLAEEENQYTFEVDKDSNKIEIAKEVERKFDVSVEKVRTNIRLGKRQFFGRNRKEGRKQSKKIAVITLASGNNIGIFKLK